MILFWTLLLFAVGHMATANELPDFIMIDGQPSSWSSVYQDVTSHFDTPFGNKNGRSTNVHETAHDIHARERNRYLNTFGKCNAFYCLGGRIVVLKDPNLTMREIVVPSALRSKRYNLYFEKQLSHWNEKPTYPLEEWSSYILGGECAVEDYQMGLPAEKSDAVSACLEFSIYAVATAMAVKKLDAEYWNSQPNFKKFIRFNLGRAERAFFKGRHIFKSQKQEELLEVLRDHEDASEIRKFMSEEFGEFFLRNR